MANQYQLKLPKYLEKSFGYVYAVEVGGYLKIGRTKNPNRRLEDYNSFPPFQSKVIVLEPVPDYKFAERLLQVFLQDFQVKGEWFDMRESVCDVKMELEAELKELLSKIKDPKIFGGYWEEVQEEFEKYARKN